MKITGYRTLSTQHALAPRRRRRQRAHRRRRHRGADPDHRDRRGHRGRRHRLARRPRPALPRDRRRGPAGRRRPVRPDAGAGVQVGSRRRDLRRRRDASTPRCGTSRRRPPGEPLWRLLGGRDRFVPAYASGLDIALDDEELAAFYGEFADRGYVAGKLKGGLDLDADLRRLRHPRTTSSRRNTSRPGLMLDANESWQVKQAVRYVGALEEQVDLLWVEEPLRRWDAVGHARLSDGDPRRRRHRREPHRRRAVPPALRRRRARHRAGRARSGASRTCCGSRSPPRRATCRSARSATTPTPRSRTP